jgi:D-aminopeptidase
VRQVPTLHDDHVTPLFLAAIESAEEAIISSLFTATATTGHDGRRVEALPVDKILPLLKR